MNYSNMIMEKVNEYPELRLIDAQEIYKEEFQEIPETTFYKVVSRLAKSGEIERVSKGIYCIPKKGRFGTIISNEENIVEYFLGENKNKGMIIGYRLFNKYGLTTQISKNIDLYSSLTIQEKRNIRNVSIKRVNLRFNSTTIKMVELLEVLEGYNNVEDLNTENLIKFIEKLIRHYDDKIIENIIDVIRYKKSTLASLKNILDFYNLENNISNYLNGTSKYKSINMEKLYESTL